VGVTGPGRFPSVARLAVAVNPEFLGKTGRNSRKIWLLIDLPKWEILSVDEGDRQEQPEEVLGAPRLR
jgi:hypothetical protein